MIISPPKHSSNGFGCSISANLSFGGGALGSKIQNHLVTIGNLARMKALAFLPHCCLA